MPMNKLNIIRLDKEANFLGDKVKIQFRTLIMVASFTNLVQQFIQTLGPKQASKTYTKQLRNYTSKNYLLVDMLKTVNLKIQWVW